MKKYKSAILESDLTKLNILLSKNEADKVNEKGIKELINLSKKKGVVKIEVTLLLKYKTELNSYIKINKEKVIISLIEELSQDIYCATWNQGIEKELWYWGKGISEPNEVFVKQIVKSDAKLAVDFGNEIGLWAEWNHKQNKPKAITIQEWIKKTPH